MFVEITEDRTLGKVRSDVNKLVIAKAAAVAGGYIARCFCVVNGPVTPAMVEAGKPHHIRVLSIEQFTKIFFDFRSYQIARLQAAFGSSINPITGEIDATEYVPVTYKVEGRKADASSRDVADWLRQGRKVIVLGEYGTGKSRCVREVYRHLGEGSENTFCYPMAIDLRRSWGLEEGSELIRRHIKQLGLGPSVEAGAVRAFNMGAFAVLLDGFDEIGSQAWSNDGAKLKAIRAQSLAGVKDLVTRNKAGVLVTGREHYFPNAEEMFSALGLSASDTIVLRVKNEFTDTELLEYFRHRNIDVEIPEWLPRRPLICQTISDLAAEQFESMFGEEGNEVAFWSHFIQVLCERDARIHVSFDAQTIFQLFMQLARVTRSKPADVGPISLTELQKAFEVVTGSAPVEEASVMLQRLPSLGRISPESNDRQFVDIYILDGLRAKDVAAACLSDEEFTNISSARWNNSLDDLGQRVLAGEERPNDHAKLEFARKAANSGNIVLASDLVASLTRSSGEPVDFSSLTIEQGDFRFFSLSERPLKRLTLKDCYFGELALPVMSATQVAILDCSTPRVTGVTSASALPTWVKGLEAEQFDSVESVSRIRKIGLGPAHEILITIIRKTFFQKGAGRKEEALLRGLGTVASKATSAKVLNAMKSEGLLTSFRGDEGEVYAPVRTHTKRMQLILDELNGSSDPLWLKVGEL